MTVVHAETASFAEKPNDTDTMPRDKSGDFLLDEFYNPVASTQEIYTDETASAYITKERVQMENGTWYEVTSTHAKHRTIDVGIVATAAWLTHDRGLNADHAQRAAAVGIDTVFISPQQNWDRRGHFGKSVCNILEIADFMNKRADRDPDNLWADGDSRGSMHALGVTAKAPYVGKKVIVGDYRVACFPDGIDLARDLPKLPHMIFNEFHAATAFLTLPANALLEYPRTLAFHPRMLFQHAKEVPTLLSGAAGKAAEHMPLDTFGHVTNFVGDIMGQGNRWKPKFDPYENLSVENFNGAHLSITDPRCMKRWDARMRAAHEVIESYPRIVELGGTAMKQAISHISTSFSHRAA